MVLKRAPRVEATAQGVAVEGALTLAGGEVLRLALLGVTEVRGREVVMDLKAVTAMDTVGALWLLDTRKALHQQGRKLVWQGLGAEQKALLQRVEKTLGDNAKREEKTPVRHAFFVAVGKASWTAGVRVYEMFGLLGQVVIALGQVMVGLRPFRWNALVRHIKEAGLYAVPIVALISFLMSIVLAYQGVAQLKMFGAQQYAINLVAVAVLREMGGLLAAIMVAGRSGSSFTSEIGVMKIREEVDALKVMGMTPMDVMILPRIVALVIVMPLLTFVAFVAGLLGGALVSVTSLGVGFTTYLQHFAASVSSWTHWIGLVKAPVFALFIGLISCMAGMRVRGSAESVGRETTSAVVQGIFAVLVLDALFSVFFAKMGW